MKIKQISDEKIQYIYSKFDFLFFSASIINNEKLPKISFCKNDRKRQIEDFLFNYLQSFKLIVFQLFNISNNNRESMKNIFSKPKNVNDNLFNAVLCVENKCLLLKDINHDIIQSIFSNLKKQSSVVLVLNPISNIIEENERQMNIEINNFCNNFTQEIKTNDFVRNTIKPMIGYLIKRYYYPTEYFKDPSFFIFNQQFFSNEQKAKRTILNFLKNKEKDENSNQKVLNSIIDEIEESNETDNHTINFSKDDFIFLRTIDTNDTATFHLVIHIKSLFLFMIKNVYYNDKTMQFIDHEINFCSKYSHRCMVHFYGFLKEKDKIIGFVYEFMSNGTLESFIKSNQKLDEIYQLMIISRIYKAIYYLHSNFLIHRDLKPSNILLDHDFLPYVSDFETIRPIKSKTYEQSKNMYTYEIGSLYYVSPEQFYGLDISYSTDIYSFGLIIYFILEKRNLIVINDLAPCFVNDNTCIKFENTSFKSIFQLCSKCIKKEPTNRISLLNIKKNIIEEFNQFDYIELYFVTTKRINQINTSYLVQYFYEIITIQSDKKEKNTYKFFLLISQDLLNNFASNDYASFLLNLASLYIDGLKFDTNFIKARKYCEISAKLKNSEAFVVLGNFYLGGLGVEQDYSRARIYYELAAKQNNSNAYLNLGVIYSHGLGVEQNSKKAIKYYKLSASLNNKDAFYNLGILYEEGQGVEPNYLKAIKYFELAAEQRNSNAFVHLALFYEEGLGVKQDFSITMKYYNLAAELNNPDALFNLAVIYEKGQIVEQNYLKAKEYYELSLKQDKSNIDALINLGNLYSNGNGVQQDYLKAKEYYELAAEQEDYNAIYNIGYLYEYGFGVEQNLLKARELYELAGSHGVSLAYLNIGNFYSNGKGVEQNSSMAIHFFEMAAQLNNSTAIHNIGVLFYQGKGVKKDYLKAKEYFELAAQQNNHLSLYNLGCLYFNGYGVAQNYKKAKKYFELAAQQNNDNALLNLGCLYYYGLGVNRNFEKAKWFFEEAEKQNNSSALIFLGMIYFYGHSVARDYLKAKHFYELSSLQNNSYAFILLGDMYCFGSGVEQDYLIAKKYYELAAKQNNSHAFLSLGNLYYKGYGVQQNYSTAKKYYELAAFQSHPDAYLNLGILYENGDGVEQNFNMAKFYYENSAKQNNFKAFFYLGEMFSVGYHFDINIEKAIYYYKKCSKIHFVEYKPPMNIYLAFRYNRYCYRSSNNLGLIYLTVLNDLDNSIEYLKESGYGEYPFGQNNLGLLYQFFLNDIGKSLHMFMRSAEHNFSLAEFNLAHYYEKEGKNKESIEYYIRASEHENEPLIFQGIIHNDLRLEVSKMLIICFTNLKLVHYYFAQNDFVESKKYLLKSLQKLLEKSDNSFHIFVDKMNTKNIFKYLKNFILNHPLFNLKNQPNNNDEIRKYLNDIDTQKDFINESSKKTRKSREINYKEQLFKDNKECQKYVLNINAFTDLAKFFDFVINDDKLKYYFLEEIRDIISFIEKILYSAPYSILFGRIDIVEPNPTKNIKSNLKDINQYFYEGFEINIDN